MRLFGTDGVRGIAGDGLTAEFTYTLGAAACRILGEGKAHPLFVLGRDTRISGDMLFCALASGIMSVGGRVLDCGVLPTPAVALLTRHFSAEAGAVISASHNPYCDNGIKFFGSGGGKLNDETEDRIEAALGEFAAATHGEVGTMTRCEDAGEIYKRSLRSVFPQVDLSGLHIALDCANGAMSGIAPDYFRALGAAVDVINDDPNGVNINAECGSTHTKALCEFVKRSGAALGLAFDGDGDRLIAVDETGREVDGDAIMFILAKYLRSRGELAGDTLVVTVMSNSALKSELAPFGIKLAETKVGDRYILEEMLRCGYSFGGEQSGHMINMLANTTGDGLASGTLLSHILSQSDSPLSVLAGELTVYPQKLINVTVPAANKLNFQHSEAVSQLKREIEDSYGGRGRVLLRPSGTEALVRVMVEGESIEQIEHDAARLAELIERISK